MFDAERHSGLSSAEALKILARDGPNELPSSKPRSLLAIALSVFKEPMFVLLIIGGLIYLGLGEVYEALLLLGFVFVVMGITLYEERKTENALSALRNLASPRARVIRDGRDEWIAGREVVAGDVMLIAEGMRVAADGVLLSSVNLSIDESLLTGESAPVRKCAWNGRDEPRAPGGENQSSVYSGALVVRGQGVVCVTATGASSEIGKLGTALHGIESNRTSLQVETDHLVRLMALVGLSMCVIAAVVYGITRGDWIRGLLAGVALAMAVIPEEFPVVLTVFLALGAWRISRKGVLTRHIPAIEALGSATVLCVDKTGTLTMNRMSVAQLYENCQYLNVIDIGNRELPETYHSLVEFAVLASQRDPFDPMEKAIRSFGDAALSDTEHLHGDWQLVREYPLSDELLAVSQVWISPNRKDYVIAAKGAPEAIIDLCHMSELSRQIIGDAVAQMADDGLRIIGVAAAEFSEESNLPRSQHVFSFNFLGLIGLADPLRPNVKESVAECAEAGVRVVMITGDYPGTARSIAAQCGLQSPELVTLGTEVDGFTDTELAEVAEVSSVFARVIPEQKLRLVRALQMRGEVTAMTGDGVNDAPALKAADIGIAMGGRGTDVAREAADLVLLNDDFTSIVSAIRLGRRIFDNLRKAMAYIIAIHIPIIGLSLVPIFLGLPLILMPVHIVFMELIIDPACSVVFEAEPEERDVMNRPPRRPWERVLSRQTVVLSLAQGMAVTVVCLLLFWLGLREGMTPNAARSIAFTALIVANVGLIIVKDRKSVV